MSKTTPLLPICMALLATSATAFAQPAETNAPSPRHKTVSVREMLVIGSSGLKLHSLAMITQGKVQGPIDASYLPGFEVCANDSALPVRSVTARLLGKHFVQGRANPDPKAVALLMKLSNDKSPDVRFNAVHYGLTRIRKKPQAVVERLVDVAADDCDQALFDRIVESLRADRERVVAYLDAKLAAGDDVAYFEIYRDLVGRPPPHAETYLDKPSSRPRLYLMQVRGNPSDFKLDLERHLAELGIEHAEITLSGFGDAHVVLLKTYLVGDRLTVDEKLVGDKRFNVTQSMWLTPQLETQIEGMGKSAGTRP